MNFLVFTQNDLRWNILIYWSFSAKIPKTEPVAIRVSKRFPNFPIKIDLLGNLIWTGKSKEIIYHILSKLFYKPTKKFLSIFEEQFFKNLEGLNTYCSFFGFKFNIDRPFLLRIRSILKLAANSLCLTNLIIKL